LRAGISTTAAGYRLATAVVVEPGALERTFIGGICSEEAACGL
jgi:hypothetical protein